MTATQTHRTTVRTDRQARPSVRRTLLGGAAGGAAGAVALLWYGALAIAIHGPMQAGDYGASHASPVNAASFSIGVLFSVFFGTLIAAGIARWAARPQRTFLRTAVVLTIVSLAAPLGASHTTEATRLILATGHLIAAVVVIPVILRALRTPTA